MSDPERRVPEWFVERLVAGDLPDREAASVRARLEAADELDRVEALRTSNAALLARFPTKAFVERLERSRRAGASNGARRERWREVAWRSATVVVMFAACTLVAWSLREKLLLLLVRVSLAAWHSTSVPHSAHGSAIFPAYERIAVLGGICLSLPLLFYQSWTLLASGRYVRARRLAAAFVSSSSVLIALVGWLVWSFAAPGLMQNTEGFASGVNDLLVMPQFTALEYLQVGSRLMLVLGVAAELVVVVVFLRIADIVSHRDLLRVFRHFVVGAFGFAAFVTPPDPVSQVLLASFFCAVYAIAIGVAFLFRRAIGPRTHESR